MEIIAIKQGKAVFLIEHIFYTSKLTDNVQNTVICKTEENATVTKEQTINNSW